MRVTVEPEPLIGIVAILGEAGRRQKHAASTVRLSASAGKVYIESKVTAAVTDAAVWEEGQCSVRRARLLAALKICRQKSSITLKADEFGLHLDDGMSVPVAHYTPQALLPDRFQIFLATKSGTVSSAGPPQPWAAAA
jgi:hypothetical protein